MRYKAARFLFAGALIALPPLLLGVAPALQDLVDQVSALKDQIQTLQAESQAFQQGPIPGDRVRTEEAISAVSELGEQDVSAGLQCERPQARHVNAATERESRGP